MIDKSKKIRNVIRGDKFSEYNDIETPVFLTKRGLLFHRIENCYKLTNTPAIVYTAYLYQTFWSQIYIPCQICWSGKSLRGWIRAWETQLRQVHRNCRPYSKYDAELKVQREIRKLQNRLEEMQTSKKTTVPRNNRFDSDPTEYVNPAKQYDWKQTHPDVTSG